MNQHITNQLIKLFWNDLKQDVSLRPCSKKEKLLRSKCSDPSVLILFTLIKLSQTSGFRFTKSTARTWSNYCRRKRGASSATWRKSGNISLFILEVFFVSLDCWYKETFEITQSFKFREFEVKMFKQDLNQQSRPKLTPQNGAVDTW